MENKALVKKGRFKKGNKGKPKGATNLITRSVKEALLVAFNQLQDHPTRNLYKFGVKYPKEFYAIAAKLIPTEIHAKINKVELHIVRTGGDLPQNFAPATTEDTGYSEAIQQP